VEPRPDIEVLANDDLLVPFANSQGEWEMTRISRESSDYDEWREQVYWQRRWRGLSKSATRAIGGLAAVAVLVAIIAIAVR
jgi:hypothetical protein